VAGWGLGKEKGALLKGADKEGTYKQYKLNNKIIKLHYRYYPWTT